MSEPLQAYCVKCKTKREITNPEAVYTKTGTPGTRGQCAVCGTTLFRMGQTEAHAHIPKPEKTEKPKRSKKPAKTKAKASKRTGKKVGKLVIVESPAKARTVGNFLGKGYTVKASKGHVRDLLVSQLSVDVENDFEPTYRVMNNKRDVVKELKQDVAGAEEIYLATDPDREGEAIAWHLISATNMEEEKIRRVVFHEITDSAVEEAFAHPRDINHEVVDAYQARRILDRLVGYNITELLWQKVRNQLTAGRVQSIAVRMVVDREREIEGFTAEEYWSLEAELKKQGANGVEPARSFIARLLKIDGKDIDFKSEADVKPHLEVLEKSLFQVKEVKRGTRQRRPSAPFTTSTLQQEASRRLGFNARRTMSIAQQLYEGINIGAQGTTGLITYMRTDSTNISKQAQDDARQYINARYGKNYTPSKPPVYRTRAKSAQEAHEAIRPTAVKRTPDSLKDNLSRDQLRLYTLIWERFVASQMANAVYNTIRVDIQAGPSTSQMPYAFRASGSNIKFPGFLALYEDTRDEDTSPDADEGREIPDDLSAKEWLDLVRLLPEQHFTQPPPRYTEASLVRTLEEYGIGRPSTYAPTVASILDREYVKREDKRLVPTEIGKTVNDLLVEFFPEVMDYQFTAYMEEELDSIAEGKMRWRPMLNEFYGPFEAKLDNARKNMPQVIQEERIGRDCPSCGGEDTLVIRYGRYGKFIGCTNYPECRYTEPWLERTGIKCPVCGDEHGGEIVERKSRRGRTFYGCARYPDCDFTSWKRPLPQPCPNCGELLVEQNRTTAQCTNCENTYKLDKLPAVMTEPA